MMNVLAITAALSLASTASLVQARPMHAAIAPHYARYLQEREDMSVELEAWMNKFKEGASANGWIPKSEARSADDEKEDQMQRFFLTKERIKELELENPDAKFSTDSPFTLMTDDEFNTYVGNAYRKAEDPVTRKLRGAHSGGWNQGGDGGSNTNHRSWNQQRSSKTMNQDRSADSKTGSTKSSSTGWSYQSSWTRDASGKKKSATTWSGTPPAEWLDWWNKITINHSNNNNYVPVTVAPYNPDTAAPATSAPEPASDGGDSEPAETPDTNGGDSDPVVAPEETEAPATSEPASSDDNSNNLPVAPEEPASNDSPTLTAAPQPATDNTGYDFDAATAAPVAAEADSQSASGTVDWSKGPCVSPIQNQGQCGSCWAFASIAAVESAQCIAGGQKSLTKYSEQQLASCDTRNFGCNGGAPTYAFDYIQKNGVCTETAYPYASSNGRNAACAASCQKVDVGIKGSAKVSGEDGLLSTLAQHPVVVAVAAGNNAWKQYQGGILSACDTSQVDHAVLAVGYDGDTIKIKNSWGERWGESGYIRLRRGVPGVGTCGVFTDMSHPLV